MVNTMQSWSYIARIEYDEADWNFVDHLAKNPVGPR